MRLRRWNRRRGVEPPETTRLAAPRSATAARSSAATLSASAAARASRSLGAYHVGLGRELFASFRASVTSAEEGAMSFGMDPCVAAGADAGEAASDLPLVAAEEGV